MKIIKSILQDHSLPIKGVIVGKTNYRQDNNLHSCTVAIRDAVLDELIGIDELATKDDSLLERAIKDERNKLRHEMIEKWLRLCA